MNSNMTVTKRCGERETIDLDKIHRVITWAAKGLKNVSIFYLKTFIINS